MTPRTRSPVVAVALSPRLLADTLQRVLTTLGVDVVVLDDQGVVPRADLLLTDGSVAVDAEADLVLDLAAYEAQRVDGARSDVLDHIKAEVASLRG